MFSLKWYMSILILLVAKSDQHVYTFMDHIATLTNNLMLVLCATYTIASALDLILYLHKYTHIVHNAFLVSFAKQNAGVHNGGQLTSEWCASTHVCMGYT